MLRQVRVWAWVWREGGSVGGEESGMRVGLAHIFWGWIDVVLGMVGGIMVCVCRKAGGFGLAGRGGE